MKKRPLGNSGLEIAPFVLGGNVFGWTSDERNSHAVLDAFVGAGGNAIDTADVYSAWIPGHQGGESESVIGTWLNARGQRDRLVVITKCGLLPIDGKAGLGRATIETAVEASLGRLRTDYIDLYFAHIDDAKTPLDETLEAFDRLARSGKVRAIGASNYGAERLVEALSISERNQFVSYTVLQPEYNLVARDKFEGPLQALCRERDIGVIPYYGLAGGFLTGKYRSEADLVGRSRAYAAGKYLNPQGLATLDVIDRVARRRNASPAQIALGWLMAQPTIVAPIASATTVAQLEELLGATSLELTEEDLAALTAA